MILPTLHKISIRKQVMLPKIKRIDICNIPVDSLTMSETLDIIDKSIQNREPVHHVVINAAKVVHAQKDAQLRESIKNAHIINADGQSIVWASRILKKALPERVTGIDLMENLVSLSARRKYKIYLLGGKEDVVKKVADIYSMAHGPEIIAGFRNGYFFESELYYD